MSLHTHCDVPGCTSTAPLAGLSFAYEEIDLAEGWKNGVGEIEHICPAHPVRIADGESIYAAVGENDYGGDVEVFGIVRGYADSLYTFEDPAPPDNSDPREYVLPLESLRPQADTRYVVLGD